MNRQLKQTACRWQGCRPHVQPEHIPAPIYPTFTGRHMTLLVRELRLSAKMARQQERNLHRSRRLPLTRHLPLLTRSGFIPGRRRTNQSPAEVSRLSSGEALRSAARSITRIIPDRRGCGPAPFLCRLKPNSHLERCL